MTKFDTNTTLHDKLINLSEESSGFSVSELTGYSPVQVRGAAESLVKAGKLVKIKVSGHRIRYFANEQLGKKFTEGQVYSQPSRSMTTTRVNARWNRDEPGRITSKTKIFVAPPLPRNVYWTNTYPKF